MSNTHKKIFDVKMTKKTVVHCGIEKKIVDNRKKRGKYGSAKYDFLFIPR
jgi:hypothetical protein